MENTTDTAPTTTTSDEPNVGIAFALVIGAGAATALGAAVVFFPRLVKLASRRTLAAALGLSAGVMTYVSFVEIFRKSWLAFVDAGFAEDREAYIYATVCFFSGVVLMVALNAFVTWLLGGHHHHHHHDPAKDSANRTGSLSRDSEDNCCKRHEVEEEQTDDVMKPHCACCSEDPAGDLQEYQRMANEIETYEEREHHEWEGTAAAKKDEASPQTASDEEECKEEEVAATAVEGDKPSKINSEEEAEETEQPKHVLFDHHSSINEEDADDGAEKTEEEKRQENKKLMRMSVNTALAIGIHNFPEGLATFVAALADPAVGVVLAVAISIHNIPEGLCVAMPVYYATGNKWKAFGWGCLSGVSEPIAALLGWAVLANTMSNTVYAILFGLVGGMMVIISTKELLPTAHRYDPEDKVVTYSFMVGMAIMALSLVLFVL